MRKRFKKIGAVPELAIIVIAVVIGFSMTACPSDPPSQGTEQSFTFGMVSGGINVNIVHNSGPNTVVITANNTFTNYKWYRGTVLQTAVTGNVLTIEGPHTAGRHAVTVEAMKDGMPYATTVFYDVN